MSRSNRLTVALRELASLRSEKTIVLALLIQLFVAAFSSFLVVGLVSMYDPSSADDFSLTVGVAGEETETLVAVMEEEPAVRPTRYDTPAAAEDAFRDGNLDAVVYTERLSQGEIRATVLAPDGSFRTTMTVVKMRDAMQRYERALREQRGVSLTRSLVDLPADARSSPYFGFTYAVLVPLLVFLPAFIGGSVAVDSLAEEVERGTMELLRVTPTTLPEVVDGKLLAAAAPVPVQVTMWMTLLWANGTAVANLPLLVLFASAVAVAVTALGLGVSVATQDRRQAQFLYSSGMLALFAASLLLPETPQNVVARLAIGSAGPAIYSSVAGTVVLSAVALVAVRWTVPRLNTDSL